MLLIQTYNRCRCITCNLTLYEYLVTPTPMFFFPDNLTKDIEMWHIKQGHQVVYDTVHRSEFLTA